MDFHEIDSGSVILDGLTYMYRIIWYASNDNNNIGDRWFCGYVSVPVSNRFFGLDYDTVQEYLAPRVELTYDNGREKFGFDTHHVGMENLTGEDVRDMTLELLHDFHDRGYNDVEEVDSP